MVEISIICLIYKSCKMADKVYESILNHTPLLHEKKAEFFFVANNPTKEVLNHLKQKNYPFIECWSDVLSEEQMDKLGYAKPNYMRNVYQGYNFGILNAKGKIVVLINSDNLFSDDWLENLLKYADYKHIVCSTLVEPGKEEFSVFPGAVEKNFGKTITTFNEEEFLKFARSIRKTGIKLGGAYMPCLFYKEIGIVAGLYPEGNIKQNKPNAPTEFGDENFYRKLNEMGVLHITSKDSIVYHLKEGEKSESIKEIVERKKSNYKFKNTFKYNSKNILVNLSPTLEHKEVISNLLLYVCIYIYKYKNEQEIEKQINDFLNQTYSKLEIIVCLNKEIKDLKALKEKYPTVKFLKNKYTDLGTQLYNEIYNMNSSFMLFSNPNLIYKNTIIEELVNSVKVDASLLKNAVITNDENQIQVGYSLFQKNNFTKDMLYWLNIVIDNEKIETVDKDFIVNKVIDNEKSETVDKESTVNKDLEGKIKPKRKITIKKVLRYAKNKIVLMLRK